MSYDPKTDKGVLEVAHPLVKHKLTLLRRKDKSTADFRIVLRELSLLLGYEAMRDLPTEMQAIETPLEPMDAPVVAGKKLCFVSILRAGDGLLGGMLDLVPSARVGHIGLYRDPDTKMPVHYLTKLPKDLPDRQVILLDPMLATGNSLIAAIDRAKELGAERIRVVCILAAPEGLEKARRHHPDVEIITAAIDRQLNEKAYILPGLGDAGDRLFGTK